MRAAGLFQRERNTYSNGIGIFDQGEARPGYANREIGVHGKQGLSVWTLVIFWHSKPIA